MASLITQKNRLERALVHKDLYKMVTVDISPNDMSGELVLIFPDKRQAFGDFDELSSNIEAATSLQLLMASCDLDELLSD